MKFLYFTDSHLRVTNPKNRIDNFYETLKNKMNEILQISLNENVDYILHGGDLFDRPDTPISLVSDFSEIFQKFKAPIYIVSGNHDIFGHNPITVHRTMFGLLDSFGIIRMVNNKVILKKDVTVQLTSFPYSIDMDSPKSREGYIVREKDDVDYAIHLTHGFLTDKKPPDTIPHTLISDISDTVADVTFGGHIHYGFKTIEIDGKYFINPGSIVRISNALSEFKRKPKVVILELTNKIDIREINLKTALPAEEVLDRSEIEHHKFKTQQFNDFKSTIESSSNLKSFDVFDILVEIAKNNNISKEVRDEAIKRVELKQIEGADYN
ncbi:metallophosphoesterase family protein [Peptoniphilus indolicus]|uniref:Ser/Thr protein phosphatase n=2 Tax=Peptoniphilus indolicus TaxID=33030 RepID=G4D5N0_9FIRM|nr:metallophosphoesterase [Peptoniphilus indolicus]EGY78575.1 Ser/Thr protein phosphatase [Peptoniphilus indolicus ATCC 29427]SUB76099.1 phosphodiesterase, MJ0936 family [Peptoniphilus indolicus]